MIHLAAGPIKSRVIPPDPSADTAVDHWQATVASLPNVLRHGPMCFGSGGMIGDSETW